jgi:hypothetical protein
MTIHTLGSSEGQGSESQDSRHEVLSSESGRRSESRESSAENQSQSSGESNPRPRDGSITGSSSPDEQFVDAKALPEIEHWEVLQKGCPNRSRQANSELEVRVPDLAHQAEQKPSIRGLSETEQNRAISPVQGRSSQQNPIPKSPRPTVHQAHQKEENKGTKTTIAFTKR